MNFDARRSSFWPCGLAVLFFSIPLVLFQLYPSSFWANDDYEPLGLANAMNLAYRLADLRMYPARGLMDHPGVPYYFMSWVSLALSGHPLAPKGPGFLDALIGHVEPFHRITVWLAATTGAAGVYIFVRTARNLAPIGVIAAALLIWLGSTPATLLSFVSPSIDTFAIIINVLSFAVLLRLADDPDVSPGTAALSASVGALAYLNKLSYIYIPLALAVAGIANAAFRRVNWSRGVMLSFLFVATFLFVVTATGFLIIGEEGFQTLREFHKSIFRHSGHYGTGEAGVVSQSAILRALAAIPAERTYAMILALVGGPALVVGGLVTGLKRPRDHRIAIICIGTGIASFLSAAIVMKHYAQHYTAGVSATLPASVIAGYLLAKSWGLRLPAATGAVAVAGILLMAYPATASLISLLAARTNTSELAKADLEEIKVHSLEIRGAIEFAYRAPFAGYGEGLIVTYGSVPRLTEEYLHGRNKVVSSLMQDEARLNVGAYVIDKRYFPTVERVKAASNVALLGKKPVKFRDGDKLIELRTVFLLIPG
jgi:hypothetical protein